MPNTSSKPHFSLSKLNFIDCTHFVVIVLTIVSMELMSY